MKIYNLKEKPEFLEEVAYLEYNEWADNPKENYDLRIINKIEKMKKQVNEETICKLILVADKTLLGFISIFPYDCEELPNLTPWYSTMFVKKEFRGNGYSKKLNDAILKEAKNRGYKEIFLKTDLKNYYEKFGAEFIQNIKGKEKLYKFNL